MQPLALSTCWNSYRHQDGYAMLKEIRQLGFPAVELGHAIRYSLWPGVVKAWEENLISYGVNQIQGRTLPLLSGERTAQPVLPVVVNRPEGEATMFCEPPKPRFTVFRAGAGLAIHFLGVVPMI